MAQALWGAGLLYANSPVAQQGVLDLRSWDFDQQEPLKLQGEWEFYWSKLLTLQDIQSGAAGVKSYMQFPNLWANDSIDNQPLRAQGYATYRLQILVDQMAPSLAISVPDYYSATLLEVNHMVVARSGIVGVSLDGYSPHFLNHTENLPAGQDTLDFVLQIANFSHSKGGGLEYIRLGAKETMQSLMKRNWALDLLLAGCFIMGGVFFVVLYAFGRHDKTILFFALFCFTYCYRVLGTDFYTLHALFPELDWTLTLQLEYLALFLSALFFAIYSYFLYREETSVYFVRIAILVCSVFSLAVLILPSIQFTTLARPFSLFLLVNFAYLFYTYIIAAIKHREGSSISLLSTTLLFLTMGHRVFEYFGILNESRVFYFIGFLQFFFLQSIILFYRHTRRLQLAKEKAEQASKSKSDFLSMISHEIRTPLNAVIGLTNFLISSKPRKNQLEDLNTLKFSAENLHVLINDVLDYSKLDAGKIEFEQRDVNIIELAQNIVKGMEAKAKEKKISVLFVHDEIPAVVRCDGLRLSQILTNLLGNAIKFTKEGGVTLSLTKIVCTRKRVSVKFLVEDTGIGIPKEKLNKIFESFSQASTSITREYGGTGLGLSITKKILDLQNVKIHVFSKEGKGSKFYFTQTFPISTKSADTDKKAVHEDQALAGKKVLLVEDNMVNVMVARKFLTRWDIEVDVAENGLEAIQKVGLNTYDLILMDLQMPVMDGYQATEELRKNGIKTPIIALTASVMLEDGNRVYAVGIDDYVSKPFNPDELFNKIKFHMGAQMVH